jgi:hypothetical protein
MEMNVEKTMIMTIWKEPSPLQVVIDQKQVKNVEYFNYLDYRITNVARWTREVKCSIAMAKAAFNRKNML